MRFEWKTASGGPEKHSASGTRVYCSLGAECPSQWPPFVEPAGVARYSAIAQVPDHPLPFDFLQKDLHPVRGPGRNAAVKEVGVLRPDRATKDKRRSQDRPIFLIAMNEALPGILLKTVVGFRFNHLDQAMKGSKIANAGTASNLHLSRIMEGAQGLHQRRCLGKEIGTLAVQRQEGENLRSKHCANQDVGIQNQGLALPISLAPACLLEFFNELVVACTSCRNHRLHFGAGCAKSI